MKRTIIALIVIITSAIVEGQADSSGVRHFFEAEGHYGFIIPHAEEVEPLSHTNPAGFNVSFLRMNPSFESWSIFNTFWSSGIRLSYFGFGNPEELGKALLATAFVEPVIWHGKRYVLSIGGGAGLSYHTHKYDREDNPGNQFFSTSFSFPLYVYSKFTYRLTDNYHFLVSAGYNHISNGGIRQPNFGMNFPTVSTGLRFMPDYEPIPRKFETPEQVIPGISVLFQVLTSYKIVDADDRHPEKGFFASGIHIRAFKQLTGHYGLNTGGEVIFDNAIKESIRRSGKETDHKRISLTAGQDITFGRTRFTQYFGVYVYAPYKARNLVYQKYELCYMFNRKYGAGVFLKAHTYVAELMGVQVYFSL